MTLIDTSVLIDFLRNKLDHDSFHDLRNLFLSREAAVCPLIWVELFQGYRGAREKAHLDDTLKSCHLFEFDQLCWNETARVARICKQKGVNVPLSDVQIQACSLRYDLELLHRDKHFDNIQQALTS